MKSFYTTPTESEVTGFAERHLSPFKVLHGEVIADTCPFCNGGDSHDRGTFYVSIATGQYYCHRGKCNVRGGWVSLLKKFGEAPNIQSVSEQFKPLDVTLYPRTDVIDQYFWDRGINTSTLDAFQIAANDMGDILFPFYVEGELIYIKYRKPIHGVVKKKEWAQPGAPPVLFGMDLCKPDEPLVLTEGEIDALSLYEAGIRNVVSVPTGCDNFQWVEPCWDWVQQFDKIILFGDNDPPGKKMIRVLVTRLGEDKCWIIEDYPDGCKDANDILVKCGASTLREVFESAKETPIRNVIDIADVQFVDPTTIPRIKTMIPALDESLNGLEEGALVIVSGDSGSGKSTLSGTFLLNAIEQGHSVCVYSGELSNTKLFEWLTLQAAGSAWITLKHDPVKGKEVPVVYTPALERIREWLRGKCYVFDCADDAEVPVAESILQAFTVMVRRKGCKLFLVDNLMTAIMDSPDEEYRAQGKFLTALKRFALKYGVTVLLVAHPKKRSTNTFTLDDVSGNKMITNIASSALIVEKPNIRVIKARDAGLERLIECGYCGDSRRIYQLTAGDLNEFSWDKTGLIPPKVRADSKPEYGVFTAAPMF